MIRLTPVKDNVMSEEFNTASFLKAIPKMFGKVWPGVWVIIVVIPLVIHFTDTTTNVMSLDIWLTVHIQIFIGLIALTVWMYNSFERYAANMLAIGTWLIASGICYLVDDILQLIVSGR
jgi:hypothetical protein